MTYAQLLNRATEPDGSHSLSSLDAELLLAFILKADRPRVLARLHDKVELKIQHQFDALVARHRTGIPLAYLVLEKNFYGRKFFVSPDVLIPRPETELLVEEALNFIDRYRFHCVADIGCGSGAIALTLNAERPDVDIVASDLSERALAIAQKNQQGLETNVRFLRGDLLEPLINQNLAPDMIVANLPYLNQSLAHDASISAEPPLALFSKNGQEHQLRLLNQIGQLFKPPLMILLETDPRNKNTALDCEGYSRIIKKDLAGFDRLVIFTHNKL